MREQTSFLPGERQRALAVGALATAVYLATRSRWYSADSLRFANAVDSFNPADRIDIYHLLLHPLGWGWVHLWRFAGWTGPSIHPLQVLNAVAGGISIGLVCSIATRVSRSARAGTIAAFGCAASGGLWMFATEAEDVTIGLVAHLAALRLILRTAPGVARPLSSLWLGVAIGVATLAYVNCALLLLVGALALWQERNDQTSLRSCVAMTVGFVGVVTPAIWWAGVDSLPTGGMAYGFFSRETILRGLYAFWRTLALFPGLGINDSTAAFLENASALQRGALIMTYAVTAIVAAMPLVLLRSQSLADHLQQRLLLWVFLYATFAFWWVPSDLEFWLPVTIAWWIAVALLIANQAIDVRTVVGLAVALLLLNGLGLIRQHGNAEANAPLQTALRLGQELHPADVVIASPVMDEFLSQFVRPANFRTSPSELHDALARAKARIGPNVGRLFIAGIDLDTAERRGERLRLVYEAPGYQVWELLAGDPQ